MTKAGIFKIGESGLDVSPLEQQREFSYQIRIYDRSGNKVAEIASGIKNVTLAQLQFAYLQDGGCADFSFTLGEEFIRATIGYNYRVELCFYNQPNPWYSGFITKLPEKGTDKRQTYSGYGYAKQLSWIRVNEDDLAEEVADIIEDTIDDYIVTNTDIVKDSDKLDSPIYQMISNIYWNRVPASDLFEKLRQLAGDYEWGVDEERDFYFRRISTQVFENFWIGKHLDTFKGTEDPDSVRNKLYVKCGRLTDGSDYVFYVEDATSQAAYGLREDVIIAPEFYPTFSATDLASGIVPTTSPVAGVPANMTDGNAATLWDSGAAQAIGNYIQVDLGASFDRIARVVVDSSDAAARDQFARGFDIRISTTGAFAGEEVVAFTTTAWSTGTPDVRFEPVTGRYVRITLTIADAEDWHVGLYKVYELDTSDIERWAAYILTQKKDPRKKATLTIKAVNKLIETKHVIKPFKPYGKWGIYAEDGTKIEDYQIKSIKYVLTGNSFDMSAELGQLERESVPAEFKRQLQRLEEFNMSGIRKTDDLAGGTGAKPLGITRTIIGKEQVETPHLVAGAVTTDILRALSVIASKISVSDLVDIANLLTVAAGRIVIGANVLGVGLDGILITDAGAVRRVELGEVSAGVFALNVRDSGGVLITDEGQVTQRWQKIRETDIIANTQFYDVGGLDGNTDKEYYIWAKWIGGPGAAVGMNYGVRPNGAGGANYSFQTIWGIGGTPGASLNNAFDHMWMGRADAAGQISQGECFLYAESGNPRMGLALFSAMVTAGGNFGRGYTAFTTWHDSGANIVSLRFWADNANGIGIGTHIEVWRRIA